jgi:RNA polymerase sigma factor (sigma-70 family)
MTPRHVLAPARLAGTRLLATQSDERLVDLSRAGSEPAFEAIVARYRGQLLRYCVALLGRERGEDAVQQTFVRAYDAMLRDDRPLLLKAWLYRIAHNTAHNALRDHALRHEPLDQEVAAMADRPEESLERREQLRSVLDSVQDLPPRQRDALVLRELEGRSYEEISAALGVGGGAVRQLLNRARTTLRTAATAITPVGLLLRVPGSGESVAARVAELTGAAGAGAVVSKVAATALVTGAVAGGAAVAPLGESDGRPEPRPGEAAERDRRGNGGRGPAAPVTMAPAPIGTLPATTAVFGDSSGPGSGRGDSSGPGSGRGDSSGPGSGRGDSSGPGSGPGDTSGPDDSSGPGSGRGDSSGPGGGPGDSSGPESGGRGGGNSGPGGGGNSGPGGESGSSGPGSSGGGSSGSSGPGSGSSGSGSSGSGSSGSGSATSRSGSGGGSSIDGSGTSGGGTSGSGSTVPTPATSGSGSSGSSGSGSSGSG